MSLPPVSTRYMAPAGLGNAEAAADGVVLTTGTTAFVKTGWSQLTAGLPQAISGFFLTFMPDPFDTTANTFVDIAIGASGSEVVVLENYYYTIGTFAYHGIMREFPLAIPANTRIAIRVSQGNANAKTTRVFFQPIFTSTLTPNNAMVCTTVGTTGASLTGTSVIGGNGSWGSAVTLTSGLTYPVRHLALSWFAYGSQHNHLRFSTDTGGNNRVGPAVWQLSNDTSHNLPLLPLALPANTPLYVSSNSFGTVQLAAYLFG
jgi:hypothetical protein